MTNRCSPRLRAGARGYLTKDASAADLARAIRAVHAGETHLDAEVQRRLVESVVAPPPAARSSLLADGLTPREGEVLVLIAGGLSNQEIAERLVVSLATVKTHVNRILAKTGARDRAQAVAYAYRHGIVDYAARGSRAGDRGGARYSVSRAPAFRRGRVRLRAAA